MESFLNPKSVALVGASENNPISASAAGNLLTLKAFTGKIYLVSLKSKTIFGHEAYSSLEKCPTVPELVILIIQSRFCPSEVVKCCKLGVKGIIILSSGFREAGPEGAKLEEEIMDILSNYGNKTRIIGPNCIGILSPYHGLNATFGIGMARKGSVAFISQSGAVGATLLGKAYSRRIGVSALVTVGDMMDVDWAMLIDHFSKDEKTKSIFIYMESMRNAKDFFLSARRASRSKPIVILKPGRTEAGSKAALSHTGSMTQNDSALDAFLMRSGVIRCDTAAELLELMNMLGSTQLPKGPRLGILSTAGGTAVMAADAVEIAGGKLADLSADTISALDKEMPKLWSRGNPVDITGAASPAMHETALSIMSRDPNIDALLVFVGAIYTCPAFQVALSIRNFAVRTPKPLYSAFTGGDEIKPAVEIMQRAGLHVSDFSDASAAAFVKIWKYVEMQEKVNSQDDEMTIGSFKHLEPVNKAAREKLSSAFAGKRAILSEKESKELLQLYGIPTTLATLCRSESECLTCAKELGYPLVLKLHSEEVTHKSEVGCVFLDLFDDEAVVKAFRAVKEAFSGLQTKEEFQGCTLQRMIGSGGAGHTYELMLGSTVDPTFGPIVVFGFGGTLVEAVKDVAYALPPFTDAVARDIISRTSIGTHMLKDVQTGKMDELVRILRRFSEMVAFLPELAEVDVNPILFSNKDVIALDARVILSVEGQIESMALLPLQ